MDVEGNKILCFSHRIAQRVLNAAQEESSKLKIIMYTKWLEKDSLSLEASLIIFH